jgi:hypothetical protein
MDEPAPSSAPSSIFNPPSNAAFATPDQNFQQQQQQAFQQQQNNINQQFAQFPAQDNNGLLQPVPAVLVAPKATANDILSMFNAPTGPGMMTGAMGMMPGQMGMGMGMGLGMPGQMGGYNMPPQPMGYGMPGGMPGGMPPHMMGGYPGQQQMMMGNLIFAYTYVF